MNWSPVRCPRRVISRLTLTPMSICVAGLECFFLNVLGELQRHWPLRATIDMDLYEQRLPISSLQTAITLEIVVSNLSIVTMEPVFHLGQILNKELNTLPILFWKCAANLLPACWRLCLFRAHSLVSIPPFRGTCWMSETRQSLEWLLPVDAIVLRTQSGSFLMVSTDTPFLLKQDNVSAEFFRVKVRTAKA